MTTKGEYLAALTEEDGDVCIHVFKDAGERDGWVHESTVTETIYRRGREYMAIDRDAAEDMLPKTTGVVLHEAPNDVGVVMASRAGESAMKVPEWMAAGHTVSYSGIVAGQSFHWFTY